MRPSRQFDDARQHGESAKRTKLTPPKLAQEWGIAEDKVLDWIRSGELRAINCATKLGGRPRYLIDVADLAAFERRRAILPAPRQKPSRRARSPDPDVIEFF